MFQTGEFVKVLKKTHTGKILIREEKYLSCGYPDEWFLMQSHVLLCDLEKPWYLVHDKKNAENFIYVPQRLLQHTAPVPVENRQNN